MEWYCRIWVNGCPNVHQDMTMPEPLPPPSPLRRLYYLYGTRIVNYYSSILSLKGGKVHDVI